MRLEGNPQLPPGYQQGLLQALTQLDSVDSEERPPPADVLVLERSGEAAVCVCKWGVERDAQAFAAANMWKRSPDQQASQFPMTCWYKVLFAEDRLLR